MIDIQKIIEQIKDERAKAFVASFNRATMINEIAAYDLGKIEAFDLCIQKLDLLLKDESKQLQPPDFANTMLGEVPHVVNDQQEENSKAVEGATPVVRQNEQTKKVCTAEGCGKDAIGDYNGHGAWACEYHMRRWDAEFEDEYR